jgi:hypothetical protein
MVSTMMRFAIVFFFIVKHLIFFIGICENSRVGATFTEVHENAKTGEPIPMGFSLSKIRSPYCFALFPEGSNALWETNLICAS